MNLTNEVHSECRTARETADSICEDMDVAFEDMFSVVTVSPTDIRSENETLRSTITP